MVVRTSGFALVLVHNGRVADREIGIRKGCPSEGPDQRQHLVSVCEQRPNSQARPSVLSSRQAATAVATVGAGDGGRSGVCAPASYFVLDLTWLSKLKYNNRCGTGARHGCIHAFGGASGALVSFQKRVSVKQRVRDTVLSWVEI